MVVVVLVVVNTTSFAESTTVVIWTTVGSVVIWISVLSSAISFLSSLGDVNSSLLTLLNHWVYFLRLLGVVVSFLMSKIVFLLVSIDFGVVSKRILSVLSLSLSISVFSPSLTDSIVSP